MTPEQQLAYRGYALLNSRREVFRLMLTLKRGQILMYHMHRIKRDQYVAHVANHFELLCLLKMYRNHYSKYMRMQMLIKQVRAFDEDDDIFVPYSVVK